MGSVVDVDLQFAKEKHARWAAHLVENLIKLCYAPFEGFDLDPTTSGASLSDLCLRHDETLRACDPHALASDSALSRLQRIRTRLVLERCTDVQWRVNPAADEPDDFFSQLCFTLVRRFPQMPFVGYARYEMTVSGDIQRTRASWNGKRLQFRKIEGMRPLDENCWDTWETWDWTCVDGHLRRCAPAPTALRQHFEALLADAREAAGAGDVRTALRFADDALALPHCAVRIEGLACRADVGRSLRRCGVRSFVPLKHSDLPAHAAELGRFELTELPLDVGTHVLRREGEYAQVVDTGDGSVCVAQRFLGAQRILVVDGRYLVDDPDFPFASWYFIDWDYA